MPSGKTHEKVNFIFLFIMIFGVASIYSFITYGIQGLILGLLIFFGFLFGTYYFGPDLDVKSRPYYRWKLLKFIWIPYQKVFSHRSFFTHGLFIGDIVRIIYLGLWLMPIYFIIKVYVLTDINQKLYNFYLGNYLYLIAFFGGIVLASTFHIIADITVSTIKKNRKKRTKKS